jgi:processive 1,2-diacylglycerol beta-glucosyltransferase
MKKRILLMYISISSGHHRASLAIEKALKLLEPRTEILNINSFNYTNPILERIINRTYLGVIKRMPEVWEYLYDNPKVVRNTQRLKDLIHRFNSRKLESLLKEFKPDAIVCTQAFPCGMVADYKKTFGLNVPLFGVLTDYLPHSYWFYDEVDYYIVASSLTKQKFLENGIPAGKIKTFGIPIDPKFAEVQDRERIAKKLNLDLFKPTILVMGGGQGLGPIKKIIRSLNNLQFPLQIIVVAGTNRSLLKWLRRIKSIHTKRIISFEYVENINELMDVSTILITKAGGLTIAEALVKGLAIIIVNPIPGQESNNTRFLLQRGIALEAEDEEGATDLVNELLHEPKRLKYIRCKASRFDRPNAAIDTARLILHAADIAKCRY